MTCKACGKVLGYIRKDGSYRCGKCAYESRNDKEQ